MLDRMKQMWEEVLGVKSVSPDDDFFRLGGDSLMATNLVAMIEEELGVILDATDVFEFPVLTDFLVRLKEVEDDPWAAQEDTPEEARVTGAF